MKKILLLAITTIALSFTACNSCSNNQQPVLVAETEIDSLYMLNDSTIGDKQTFIFEGLMPLENGKTGNVLLSVQTVSLNDDGTYTISTTYIDEENNPMTTNDSGESVVLIGIPNDSTAVIYELISNNNNNPRMHLKVNSDSSMTPLNKNMKPLSNNPAHKLIHKK